MYRLAFLILLISHIGLAEAQTLPPTYSAPPLIGRVVDAETGKPVEGAIVVAKWEIEKTTNIWPVGSTRSAVLHVAESLTDANGHYKIESWGPEGRPSGWWMDSGHDPLLCVFKQGYELEWVSNTKSGVGDVEREWVNKAHRADEVGPVNSKETSLRSAWYNGKDLVLYKIGKQPGLLADTPIERNSTPGLKPLSRVTSFANFLQANIEQSDELGAPSDSPKLLAAARAQRKAIIMVDRELRELRRLYNTQNYMAWTWGAAATEVLKESNTK